jgi:pyruvate/2-oxoglutarate/acetoin dehydrogenase E1 component
MHEATYLDAVREAVVEEMERDGSVVMLGADLLHGLYGGASLQERFGADRVRDLPNSEAACVGAAAGAAMTGLRPVLDLAMASFCFVAWDQFVSQVAKARYLTGGAFRLPVTYRVAQIFNAATGGQHTDRPHAMFMQVPGLKVVAPTSPADVKGLLKASIRDDDPVIFLEDTYFWATKGNVPDPGDDSVVEIGQAAVKRQGDDVTVVAIGRAVPFALAAGEELAAERISIEVIDPRTLAPLDWTTVFASVEKTGRLVVVDCAPRTCSAASEIAASVCERRPRELRSPVRRVTAPDVHSPFNPILEESVYPTAPKIVSAVHAVLQASDKHAYGA